MANETVHINRAQSVSGMGGAWYDGVIGANFDYIATHTDESGNDWYEIDTNDYRGNPNAIDLPENTWLHVRAVDSRLTPPNGG